MSKLSYNKFNSGVYPPLCIILYLPPYIKGEGGKYIYTGWGI